MQVKEGSRWWGGEKVFVVISVVESQGNTWVYYRNDSSKTPTEYSCYIESFLSRFRPLPE